MQMFNMGKNARRILPSGHNRCGSAPATIGVVVVSALSRTRWFSPSLSKDDLLLPGFIKPLQLIHIMKNTQITSLWSKSTGFWIYTFLESFQNPPPLPPTIIQDQRTSNHLKNLSDLIFSQARYHISCSLIYNNKTQPH